MYKMLVDSAKNHNLSINTNQCHKFSNMYIYMLSDLFFSSNIVARYLLILSRYLWGPFGSEPMIFIRWD